MHLIFLQFCHDCLTLFNIFILKEMLSALLSAMSQSRFSQSEGHHLRLLQQEEVLHQQMVGRQCIHTPQGRCMPRYDCRYIFIPLFLSFVIWLQLLLLHRLDFLNGWSKTWRRATVLNWPVQRSWCQEVGVLFDTCGRRSAISAFCPQYASLGIGWGLWIIISIIFQEGAWRVETTSSCSMTLPTSWTPQVKWDYCFCLKTFLHLSSRKQMQVFECPIPSWCIQSCCWCRVCS